MNKQYIQASGALFQAVERYRICDESKTFVDSCPKANPHILLQLFQGMLAKFVLEHFELPQEPSLAAIPRADSMEEHIDNLWEWLKRGVDRNVSPWSTLIPLPYSYVVPGGRFREMYYWDSFFTGEGLVASGRLDVLQDMIKNFAYLIDQFGHIPNSNRVYHLSRSQPPFFCCMLQLLEREKGFEAVKPYLRHLETEYHYWMDGQAQTVRGKPEANRRTVILKEGVVLNRYWDDECVPREESFQEDADLFERVPPSRRADLYRNIRAAAESGWDFSSRWLGEDGDMTSIQTTEIIPVDFNCLLYNAERQLAVWLDRTKESRASEYRSAAARRKCAVMEYCWSEKDGWFFDYSWTHGRQTGIWSLAGVYPLFCNLADEAQAARVAEQIEKQFLTACGVVTTLPATRQPTGQQWDYPNGWAPLQWITVKGLLKDEYHGRYEALARRIAERFVEHAERVYQRTGKMMERYDVCDQEKEGGGGEYPTQDGFGWTNGVVKAFIKLFDLK